MFSTFQIHLKLENAIELNKVSIKILMFTILNQKNMIVNIELIQKHCKTERNRPLLFHFYF